MKLTFSSMLISMLCSNVALLGIFGILYCRKRSYVYANYVLLGIFFIAVRCLLPFEFFYTLNIYSDKTLLFIQGIERFSLEKWGVFVQKFCLWVWIGGIVLKGCYVVCHQCRWEHFLSALPNSRHMLILRKLLEEKNCSKPVRLIELPMNIIPSVVGLRKPKIIIPDNLSEKDISYILLHELEHYQLGDLYFIALSQLLCVIYWWNPLVYLLRSLLKKMIEFRVDSRVSERLNEEQKIDYSQSIINVLKQHLPERDEKINIAVELRFSYNSMGLNKRFENIFYDKKKRCNYAAVVIASVLFFISTWVIIEPGFSVPEMERKYAMILQDTSCIYEFGRYKLYVGEKHWFTLIGREFTEEWPGEQN